MIRLVKSRYFILHSVILLLLFFLSYFRWQSSHVHAPKDLKAQSAISSTLLTW